jgi:rRNA maturation endonuclease Nob1
METQVWKLRCRGCGQTFEVALPPEQKTAELAKQKPCPACHSQPGSVDNPWHQIVGFQSRRDGPNRF